MPIHLSSFMGGLGNQMFSITAIISLAYEHNTVFSFNKTQDLAPGISVSRVYYDIYNKLCKHIKYKDFDESLPQINYCTEQFKDINIK